jgi:hypothetical protein
MEIRERSMALQQRPLLRLVEDASVECVEPSARLVEALGDPDQNLRAVCVARPRLLEEPVAPRLVARDVIRNGRVHQRRGMPAAPVRNSLPSERGLWPVTAALSEARKHGPEPRTGGFDVDARGLDDGRGLIAPTRRVDEVLDQAYLGRRFLSELDQRLRDRLGSRCRAEDLRGATGYPEDLLRAARDRAARDLGVEVCRATIVLLGICRVLFDQRDDLLADLLRRDAKVVVFDLIDLRGAHR